MECVECITAFVLIQFAKSYATEHYPVSDFTISNLRANQLRTGLRPLNNPDLSYLDMKLGTESEIDNSGLRRKRNQASEEYNYSKTYDQFLAENFGIFNSKSSESSNDSVEHEQKENQSCYTYFEDGKQCTVCKHPITNARAEKCSYSSSPKEQKYAYKREKNYASDDGREQENNFKISLKPEQENSKKNSAKHLARKIDRNNSAKNKPKSEARKAIQTDVGLPRFKFLDKVVKDFKTKDWSKCRTKHKNGVICHYCKNKDGIKNQECIYGAYGDHNGESEESTDGVTQKAKIQSEKLSRARRPDSRQAEKHIFKRTISMQIHTAADESSEITKPFLYAKSIVHVAK